MNSDNAASILDATLDDMPDLPGFKIPPTGAYAVSVVSVLEKKIGDHPAVEAKFRVVEVMEISETGVKDDEMPVKDDEFSTAFMLDNDTGVGFLKAFLKPIGEALGLNKNREIMEQAKNINLAIVIKRSHKKETDTYYCNLKRVEVL